VKRRTLLSGACIGALSGCLSAVRDANDFDPGIEPVTYLGDADPVSFNARPERRYESIDSNGMVQFRYNNGETDEMPFDEWATRRASDAARSYIIRLLDEHQIGNAGLSVGQSFGDLSEITGENDESEFKRAVPLSIVVGHYTMFSRQGAVIDKPTVEFDAVVPVTPRAATVTMVFPERTYTAVLPVVCQRGWAKDE
jgi:hypothetical protein